jgi:hypothetical protein
LGQRHGCCIGSFEYLYEGKEVMGKVHGLIGEQLKAADAETSAPAAETSGDALRDGLINKAREVFEKMLTHWNNLSTEEVKVIVDDLTHWEDMAATTIAEMAAETANAVQDAANSEAVAVVAVPPTVTDPPTPEPEHDVAGEGPGLAGVVVDIADVDAGFFEDFSTNGFFEGFSASSRKRRDFTEAPFFMQQDTFFRRQSFMFQLKGANLKLHAR